MKGRLEEIVTVEGNVRLSLRGHTSSVGPIHISSYELPVFKQTIADVPRNQEHDGQYNTPIHSQTLSTLTQV
jgi:hypothetical protein